MMDKYYVKIASGSIAIQNHSEQHMIEVTTLDLVERQKINLKTQVIKYCIILGSCPKNAKYLCITGQMTHKFTKQINDIGRGQSFLQFISKRGWTNSKICLSRSHF